MLLWHSVKKNIDFKTISHHLHSYRDTKGLFYANHFIDHILCQVLLPVSGVLHFHRRSLQKNNSINFVIMNLVANRIVNTIIPGVHFAAALVPKTPLVVMPSF